MKKLILIISIAFFLLNEILINIYPGVGFLIYSLAFGAIMMVLAKMDEKKKEKSRKEVLLITFALIPMFMRMIELFINFSFLWRTLIFYNFLLFLVIYYSFKFKVDIGYNTNKIWLLIIALIAGISLGLLGNYLSSYLEIAKTFEIVVFLPLIAFTEEILFRGLIQNVLNDNYGKLTGILVSSLLYGIFSLGFGPIIALFMFFSSLISSTIYAYSKNIFPSILLNLIITLFAFVL